MLTIYHPDGRRKHSIKDIMFGYITGQELLQQHPECDSKHWSFIVYPDMVRFTTGDSKIIRYAFIDDILDIGPMKKVWYCMYCEAHDYIVIKDNITHSNKFNVLNEFSAIGQIFIDNIINNLAP